MTMHLYKCSGGDLFLSEEDDIEAGCTVLLQDGYRCGLMGWHNEHCACGRYVRKMDSDLYERKET